jgi:Ca2+-binding EF-hand superfamily protein
VKQQRDQRIREVRERLKARDDLKELAAKEAMRAQLAASEREKGPSEYEILIDYTRMRWDTKFLRNSALLDYFIKKWDPAYEAAKLLRLSAKDLCKFKSRFNAIDTSKDGQIDYVEFLDFIWDKHSSLPPYDTPYVKAIFRLFDKDESGDVNFGEFLLTCIGFGTWTRHEILLFAFSTVDVDGSGLLDEPEFRLLLDSLTSSAHISSRKGAPVARGVFPGSFKVMLETYDINEDGLLDFNDFRLMEKTYPLILNPLLKVQFLIWSATLGAKRYLGILEERGHSLRLVEYMHKHKNTFPPPVGCWNSLRFHVLGTHHMAKYAEPGRAYDPETSILKPRTLIMEV